MAESKYQKAVDKVQGTGASENNAPTIPIKHQDAFITSDVDQKMVDAVSQDESLETAPELYTMKEGDMVVGILEGHGPDAEFERVEKGTGIVSTSTVKTWIIASQDRRKRISILSSAQLDRKMAPFTGGLVKVIRGKDVPTNNGQRVTNYLVAGPKLEAGQTRNWATKPQIEATGVEVKQLPAGDAPANHAPATAS